jgi:hydrogenase maturation protease
MARSTATRTVRVVGLGNDLLADDAFGLAVATELRKRSPDGLEAVHTTNTGFRLMDELLGVSRLVIVDATQTGKSEPGTLQVLREKDIDIVPGGSPHYVGVFEPLQVGRRIGLPVADEVTIVTVEVADCTTIGGPMHPAVGEAIPAAVDIILRLVGEDG